MASSLFPDPLPDPPPQLKLFVEPEGDETPPRPAGRDPTPDDTLEQLYHEFYRPVRLSGCDPSTLKEDRATLKKWRLYAGQRPIGQINRQLLSGFVEWLQTKGLAAKTVAKHLNRVQSILRSAGPDSDGSGLCAETLERVPKIKPPSTPDRIPDKAFTLAEIGSWLSACHLVPPMKHCACPPAWWQSIILFDYFCPLRFESLTAARWEWLRTGFDDRPGWWLKIPAEVDKNDGDRDYFVSSHALSGLEILAWSQLARIRAGEEVTGPIFGLPITPARIYVHARALLGQSAIVASRRQKRVFHGLRAAADTELRKLRFPIAAKRALGRSVGRDVDMGFYTGLEEYVKGMESMPWPDFERWREPQGRLF
jgi:integrase